MDRINLNDKYILVTGAAGFIGSALIMRMIKSDESFHIIGVDSLNDYYDVRIKEFRLQKIEDAIKESSSDWKFVKGNIADAGLVKELFSQYPFSCVVNFAAQAGVRYSIVNPDAYIESNIIGFYNLLEACRHSCDDGKTGVEHLVYASSSSIYGSNASIPYKVEEPAEHPVSLYAATKKSNELMAHAYSKLYSIPSTGLRFFTVYGPAGRPDMAYFGFTDKLKKNENIKIFNYGKCRRDFTYVDDVAEGVFRVMHGAPEKRTGEDGLPVPPYAIYNIGNSSPVGLMDFIEMLGDELKDQGILSKDFDIKAHEELVPMQPGDVPVTYADTSALERDFDFRPDTPLKKGLHEFAVWYKEFYCDEKED